MGIKDATKYLPYTIAVDFDGTLVTDRWPEIGEPNQEVIDYVLEKQKYGAKLILWTSRTGSLLDAAVDWCSEHGIIFDAINSNLPEVISAFGGRDSRKIIADWYIDDKAFNTISVAYAI